MKVIICVDDNGGMMYNHRRQSQDRILREHILKMTGPDKLWMNAYSRKQFLGAIGKKIVVDEDFLSKAGPEEFCLVEDQDVRFYEEKIEELVLYKWNRKYPADMFFLMDIRGWILEKSEEFSGASHEKITMEVYKKCLK